MDHHLQGLQASVSKERGAKEGNETHPGGLKYRGGIWALGESWRPYCHGLQGFSFMRLIGGHILSQAVCPTGPSISPVTPTPDPLLKLHFPPTMALSYRWNPELPFPSGNPPLLTALTMKYQLSLAEKHLPQA